MRDAYVAWARSARAGLRLPDAVAKRRTAALAAFERHGLPHVRLEGWKKTPLRALRAEPFARAPRAAAPAHLPAGIKAAPAAVFLDGRYASALSRPDAVPAGVTLQPFSGAGATVPAELGEIASFDDPAAAVTALNTALFADGLSVQVAEGKRPDRPLHVLFLSSAEPGTSSFPRLFLSAGRSAEVTLVETYLGLGDGAALHAPVTELDAGPGSHVHHVRVQREGAGTVHLGTVAARAAKDSTIRTFSLTEGAALCRVDVRTQLAGEGASCRLDGLFLARGAQHVDHNTSIDHAAQHTTSRETFKGILDGKAHGVFTGNVLVRAGAKGTDSEQENRNLILSPQALVDTTPQLEIYADDVKCRHGSTIGRLPPEQLFYLRTRGIPRHEAQRVLTLAFAGEVLDHVVDETVREALRARASSWLATATAPAEAEKRGAR